MISKELLLKKVKRLEEARKAAEAILESKSLELWEAKQLLEVKVQQRTEELRKEKEKAQAAQKAEKLFLANMSHEIRTPLNAIVGMTHLIEETHLDQKQTSYLSTLKSSALILQNLISDILDISKIDAGKIEALPEVLDLELLHQDLIKIFKTTASNKHLSIELSFDHKIKPIVYADPKLLHQVLINLMGNAIKFTKEGKVTLAVTQLEKKSNSQYLEFSITDTGIGIAPEKIEQIFEDFSQAENNTDRLYGGTGLGLSISKKLVNIMGGTLSADSVLGEGSCFKFSLELKDGQLIEQKIVEPILTKNIKDQMSILVVEDNPMNQMYIQSLLDNWSIDYTLTNNGLEALEHTNKNNYDLILMDCQMPIMDGFEATQTIRIKDNDTPIVALTASSMREDREAALSQGFTDFMTKPFTPEQLKELLIKYS